MEATGTAGGGMVSVRISGDLIVQEVSIAPEAVDPDDIAMLQDLVCVAVNDAITSAQTMANEKLGSATGGMNIPGLM